MLSRRDHFFDFLGRARTKCPSARPSAASPATYVLGLEWKDVLGGSYQVTCFGGSLCKSSVHRECQVSVVIETALECAVCEGVSEVRGQSGHTYSCILIAKVFFGGSIKRHV